MLQEDSNSPKPAAKRRRILRICGLVIVSAVAIVLPPYLIYGTNTHHSSRNTIWWTERGRSLIPPAATNIVLSQDFLDHFAIYTITEKDLNAFLDKHFALSGKPLDSFSERRPASKKRVGKAIGRFGWVVTKDTVYYSYAAGNGGTHSFYHDTKTGQTYQESAYW